MIDIKSKKILFFDLEVVPCNFDTDFDEDIQKYLMKYAITDEKKAEVINNLPFNPFTSKLVAIGMYDLSANIKGIYINAEENTKLDFTDGTIFHCEDERKMIERFWESLKKNNYNYLVTFNGREFDCPYLMLKSFELGIRASVNIMRGSDFNFRDYHIDLMKELTFGKSSPGARRKFSLDFYCRKLGIISPKAEGITGEDVHRLYAEKKYQEIADYCLRDVMATKDLFLKWNEILN